jgi:hypothetical protein
MKYIVIFVLVTQLLTTTAFAAEFAPDANLPLSEELQTHTWETCQEYGVDYDQILRIMWNESAMQHFDDIIDTNGFYSTGRMMINEINWEWLADDGLDVHDEYDNIEAGILILDRLQEEHGEELGIVAYQCGARTMEEKNITSTEFSRWVMDGDLADRIEGE